MSVMYTVIRTASPSDAPAAAHTVARLSRQRPACSAGDVPTSSPESGSSGICPEQNRKPPARMAWEYGPTAAGAPTAGAAWGSVGKGLFPRILPHPLGQETPP